MNSDHVTNIPLDRITWDQLLQAIKSFFSSEVGRHGKMLFASLIAFLLGINGLNVINSYVGRDFITAIENRNMQGFAWWAVVYVGVLATSTVVAVFYRFCEERLGLLWREWLTKQFVNRYLDHRIYYKLDSSGEIANPDQRIADDVKALTTTTLSFVLMFLNASITVVAFSGVLWSISPVLFIVAVLYAIGGSYLTIVWGRPLIGLNYSQLDKEANFRADLIHVRENAESVALLHREQRLKSRLLQHLDELTDNFRKIITVNRNLGFFTTGYNYLIQIIPALLVAPLFIRGEVEFGVITQSAMAFAHLLGAFSLIVTNFQSISAFAAVITRVGALGEAIDQAKSPIAFCEEPISLKEGEHPHVPPLVVCEAEDQIGFEGLTLFSSQDQGRVLIRDLTIAIPSGTRLLILGPNEDAKVALFRATAGIWEYGTGQIIRPAPKQIFFLPERPYMPPGTLRELLVRTGSETRITDAQIIGALKSLNLETVMVRVGGLNVERDWDDLLSLGEQQLIAFARLFLASPRFAFLDRISNALNPDEVAGLMKMLSQHGITYLAIGRGRHGRRDTDQKLENYDVVLEIAEDGTWQLNGIKNGEIV